MTLRNTLCGWILAVSLVSGCATTVDSRSVDNDGLYSAITVDDVGYIRAAVSSGAVNPNQRISAPGYGAGAPLITLAARAGSVAVLQYLIGAGANLNARSPYDETALMLACFFMSDLEGQGASYELHEAAARILVDAGASLEASRDAYTPLSYAAYQGRDRTIRFLLARGARVDGYVEDGVTYLPTPLMMATMMGHEDAARLLLKAGANARLRVEAGNTAFELARKYRQTQLFSMLRCAERLPPGQKFSRWCAGATATDSLIPAGLFRR
ncbi:MAG: ankyrin repeat domain-containing protein [Gammaproteobacteria bacterium]|nr:ankyrin repeat domain-containing protein [Gammaproteobacteria bacterium]